MSGTVFTVASGKGGVGKTTTSVNLAVALWQEGKAVALVDADIGMANLAAVLDLEPEATLHDVLAGKASVDEAAVEAQGGNLLVLAGDRSLESFADADPGRLRAAVSALAERCDYVIVDTGAGLSYEDVLPLGMADGVVLVTTPDPAAFGDTRKTMEVAALLGAPVRGLVVTRAVEDTDSEAIAGEIGAELLGTIPEDPAVMASTVAGNPLESHAPKSAAAAAYRDLAATVLAGDPEWLETHAGGRGVDAPDGQAEGAEQDDSPGRESDESAGDEPDEGVVDDAVSDTAAGEAWAAANETPTEDGAAGSTHIGDLMTEVGETDGARDPDARPRQPAADRTDESPEAGAADVDGEPGGKIEDERRGTEPAEGPGEEPADERAADRTEADEPGTDGGGGSAEGETPGPDDELEPERTIDPEDGTIDAGRATSTDEPAEQEAATDADADDGGGGAGDTAIDDGEADADDVEEPEEPDDLAEADDSEEAADAGEEQEPEGTEEREETAEESAGAGEAGEAEDAEESAGSEEIQAPEESEEEGEDAEESEEEGEDAEESEEEGEDEDGEAAKRGGFFGWLGRLFS